MYFSFAGIKLKFSIKVTMFSNLLACLQTSLKLLTTYSSMLTSEIAYSKAKSVIPPELLSFEPSEIPSIVLSKSLSFKLS